MRIANLRRSCSYTGRPFSQSVYGRARYPLGIAFDIDGVLVRGRRPIEGASQALRQLYADVNNPTQTRIPHIFLTNGGGVPESIKASELSSLLGVKILPQQVFLGHTPFKSLKDRFGDSQILAVGKGEPSAVMTKYGYRSVVSMEEYVLQFKAIDPLAKYKYWSTCGHSEKISQSLPCSKAVDAVFIVSDPVDWGRDIQEKDMATSLHSILQLMILSTRQAAFPVERLGMGAFRIALESIFNRMSETPLVYTSFGKPKVQVFRGAEVALLKIAEMMEPQVKVSDFERLYMIGDNPSTDILGAKQAGQPWFSILTRTGCFKGTDNDEQYPADLVVEDVLEAVQFILKEHGLDGVQH